MLQQAGERKGKNKENEKNAACSTHCVAVTSVMALVSPSSCSIPSSMYPFIRSSRMSTRAVLVLQLSAIGVAMGQESRNMTRRQDGGLSVR